MSCDYYIRKYLKVFYKNKIRKFIEFDVQPGYFSFDDEKEDEKDWSEEQIGEYEKYKRRCDNKLDKHSKTKVLYEDGKWLISSNEKIEYYKGLIENKHGIEKILKFTRAS